MSNKITFSEPSMAKLSWKLKHNDKVVIDGIDEMNLYVNGEPIALDSTDNQYEMEVTEDTNFYVNAKYNGIEVNSGSVVADFERKPAPCYYGTVILDSYEWNEEEAIEFIESLDKDSLDILTDENPMVVGDNIIAHPGNLVSTFDIVPNDNKYYFYCADEKVDESRPFVLYPTYYGETAKILDSMDSALDINKDGEYGLFMREVVIGDEPYYAFMIKVSNATDIEGDPVPLTFKK